MIRHYLPSIAAGLALLMVVVILPMTGGGLGGPTAFKSDLVAAQTTPSTSAQEVLFNIRLFEPTPKTVRTGSSPHEFARPAVILSVLTTYCCFSGGINLFLDDVLVNQQEKALHTCKRCSNDSEDVLWTFPPDTVADKVETPGARFLGTIEFIDIVGEREASVSVNDLAKPIDRVSALAATSGVQKIAVSSPTPEVILWFGKPDDFLKKETTTFTDQLFACADLDVDGNCDFLGLACTDGIDNDADGKTDFPNDPGCESLADADETDAPGCRDGLDNDGDDKIDFPDDPGCESADDTSETDPPPPPINRNIILKRSPKPVIITQPLLQEREVLIFQSTCATCTIQTSPDPAQFVAGTPEADAGFIIVASLLNAADQSLSHTLVVVGDAAEQHNRLTTVDGQEYLNQGEDADNQYPASVLLGSELNYFVAARVGTQFEQVKVEPTILPAIAGAPLKNGSLAFYVFQGQDSVGKRHLLITKGRHWDASTLTDPQLTPEPFFSFFQNRGSEAVCQQALQAFPDSEQLIENPAGFQLLLDLLTLCQR